MNFKKNSGHILIPVFVFIFIFSILSLYFSSCLEINQEGIFKETNHKNSILKNLNTKSNILNEISMNQLNLLSALNESIEAFMDMLEYIFYKTDIYPAEKSIQDKDYQSFLKDMSEILGQKITRGLYTAYQLTLYNQKLIFELNHTQPYHPDYFEFIDPEKTLCLAASIYKHNLPKNQLSFPLSKHAVKPSWRYWGEDSDCGVTLNSKNIYYLIQKSFQNIFTNLPKNQKISFTKNLCSQKCPEFKIILWKQNIQGKEDLLRFNDQDFKTTTYLFSKPISKFLESLGFSYPHKSRLGKMNFSITHPYLSKSIKNVFDSKLNRLSQHFSLKDKALFSPYWVATIINEDHYDF